MHRNSPAFTDVQRRGLLTRFSPSRARVKLSQAIKAIRVRTASQAQTRVVPPLEASRRHPFARANPEATVRFSDTTAVIPFRTATLMYGCSGLA
jgi:hypothetical protein